MILCPITVSGWAATAQAETSCFIWTFYPALLIFVPTLMEAQRTWTLSKIIQNLTTQQHPAEFCGAVKKLNYAS